MLCRARFSYIVVISLNWNDATVLKVNRQILSGIILYFFFGACVNAEFDRV